MQPAQISNWAAPCRHIDEKKNAKRERGLSLWFPCSCRCRQRSGRPRFAAKVTLLSLWVGRLQLDNAASAIAKSAKIQARPSWINESARRLAVGCLVRLRLPTLLRAPAGFGALLPHGSLREP